uniref:PH domain-containing protein n=1 Tax=Strongyloides papillosus TaxID=174720 RepID=A0A0N5CAS9_STREA
MIEEIIVNKDEYDMIPLDLNPIPINNNELENDINNQNDSIGMTNKKTIRTIYTHPNKMIKEARATIIPPNSRRFYSNRDIPNDVSKILDYYKLNRETTIYTEEKVENIRNFGRRMTASYQYLHRKKDIELWNIVDEVKKEVKKVESKNESEKIPGDNKSNLIQTIKGQVLKRGRGRPRKSETEKTVLEEEIIKRSDERMGDIKEIDEGCLLSTEDMLMERENNGYNMDQFLFKDSKEDETVLALASIDNDLSIDKIKSDKLKRQINNSYGINLDPMTKDDGDFFNIRESSTPFDEYGERRKIVSHTNDGKDCYRAISKEEYPIYKGRCTTLSLVDDMLQKNCSEIGYGVKYHTLKEMEMNEYDKVPKTEEAIYGPRPNAYTRFIEENKDMFLNDCSLRYVFDEIGQVRKFPLYGDDNSIPRFNFEREESTFYDNDSLEEDVGVGSFNRYRNVYNQNNLYDEEEDDSLPTDDDEEEIDDEDEEDNVYQHPTVRSKMPSIEKYQSKMMLHNQYIQNMNRLTKKQRKQRIGKPRGPYMTKKRRMEALKASQGLSNMNDNCKREKRPVGRPKGSTKRKADSCTPIDPASISLNDLSVPKKAKTEDIYSRPTFNSILAGNRSSTEYSKTKLRHVR